MSRSLRWRLSAMMFLQYAVWGVWAPILVLHLLRLDDFAEDTQTKINRVYMTMAIAAIVAPFVAGQIADRYFATQRFLALSHLLGGILLIVIARLGGYHAIFGGMLAYALIYAPTIALTNSLCFHHLPDGQEDFGKIRLWGTIGWIVIGWIFSLWIGLADGLLGWLWPSCQQSLVAWRASLIHKPDVADCLYLASGLSFVLAAFCLFLPHTPPPKNPRSPWAFLEALKLVRDRSFAVLIIVAFLVATELQFYYVLTPSFFNQGGGPFDQDQIAKILAGDAPQTGLEQARSEASRLIVQADRNGDAKLSRRELIDAARRDPAAGRILKFEDRLLRDKGGLALDSAWVAPVMTLGQICETIVLGLLPIVLRGLGFRLTIALGIAAWALRYLVFALGEPTGLVIASQTLHGFGYGFFFVAIAIYTDAAAPRDIRASAQSLLVFITMGAGMLVSSLIAGPIADALQGDWHRIFLVPAAICAACCVAFAIGFRPRVAAPAPAADDQGVSG